MARVRFCRGFVLRRAGTFTALCPTMQLSNGKNIGKSNEEIALLLIQRPARTEQGRKLAQRIIASLMGE